MDPSKGDAPAGKGLAEATPKIRRRPRTAVVVRPPRTKLITREEFELAVITIEMIAHRLDDDGRQMPDTENMGQTGDGTQIDS